ncbi:uroporphyrinogen-III C-methyltransferase [Polynucleobacter necessarius]|uniref:uroporphyrinogen-III C-methyltransferase n=1 Tax=Polynucleobacter necessarius TaxID=576610 RepID=UPI000E09AE1D|nr:uroporphyrinogen-III C-methyltransferase [Polynucleobacter necessarius]
MAIKPTAHVVNTTANTPGKVYLVGAGPSSVDLITVRGAKLLWQADIVFYDALVDPEMLTLCPQALQIEVGKRCGKLSSAQQFINQRLVDAAQKHRVIVHLKGGDPMLFGRADEEIQTLKAAGIAVEVVPGITVALAGAVSIQQSLTLRGMSRSVAFVTLAQGTEGTEHTAPRQVIQPLPNPSADTLVYYMGRKDAACIAQQLIEQSPNQKSDTPVQILEAVSTARERLWVSTLAELAKGKADPWFDSSSPALIMIGEALRNKKENSTSLEGSGSEIDNGLQDSRVFPNGRRSA